MSDAKGSIALIVISLLAAGGCAHAVKFPASRFNPPETRGSSESERPTIGRIAPLVFQSGHSVALFPRFTSNGAGPEGRDLDYDAPGAGWAFLSDFTLGDAWDAGVRIQPSAPITFRFKRMLAGEPASRPQLRRFSASANAGLGIGVSNAGTDTFDMTTGLARDANLSFTSFSFDVGLSAGMRIWPHTLIWLEPHVKLDTVSASLEFDSDTSLNQSASGSGMLWGVSLGSRFEWERLFLMVEVTWARGKFESMDSVGFFPSIALGADL